MENVFEYNMKHEERGIALIINNKKFKHFHDRKGTDVDKSNMNALFAALNFERIEIHDDLKGKEIEDTLKAGRWNSRAKVTRLTRVPFFSNPFFFYLMECF